MEARYNPQEIEKRWQRYWAEERLYEVRVDRERRKFYCLEMFPYPSGRIHMGHVRNYAIGDVIARYKRMRGYNVLHPMGWDAFGLPAENAAIKHGVHPANWTYDNIRYMREQLQKLGLSYDWQREVSTCEPEYYKWNQWLFLKMYEKGLVYRRSSIVNWCPSCETVLANEQVIGERCWRCDSLVGEKELEQWFFRITAYADELLEELEHLTGWHERVRVMQANWIGRSEGVEVDFRVKGFNIPIRVFTTRQDTLYGATFISIAKRHPLLKEIVHDNDLLKEIESLSDDPMEKEGVFTGRYAVNPLTGDEIPIWASNFVLMEYGTGAIMAVPAHDQRDFEFARKYNLPIKVVIVPDGDAMSHTTDYASQITEAYEGEGVLIDSGRFTGIDSKRARAEIADFIEANGLGRKTINYKLRDWGISRQRYWGTPIPIVYCESCGIVPVPEDELPIVLPKNVTFTGRGGNPLSTVEDFVKTRCPSCNAVARRETDTMDTFVDSSWYFIAYCLKEGADSIDLRSTIHNPQSPVNYWMPVDQYIGGIEHAVLHLLYSRFFTKVMRDIGLINTTEPFENLLTQGMVIKDGAKMSKSRGNVVDPDYLIDRYGADTVRLFCLFASPPEKDLEWSDQGVEGAQRFLRRVWMVVHKNHDLCVKGNVLWRDISDTLRIKGYTSPLLRKTHQTIKRVTSSIEMDYHFNTAISSLMELVNELTNFTPSSSDDEMVVGFSIRQMVLLLSPFAPHISEELWQAIGNRGSIFNEQWPTWDEEFAREEEVELVIQINGKMRGKVMVPAGMGDEDLKRLALNAPRIQDYIKDKPIKRMIVVRGRLVNIVV
ncbi:MAG: leucine--tRNA ligase [Thermodesulfovibrionia bacterium]